MHTVEITTEETWTIKCSRTMLDDWYKCMWCHELIPRDDRGQPKGEWCKTHRESKGVPEFEEMRGSRPWDPRYVCACRTCEKKPVAQWLDTVKKGAVRSTFQRCPDCMPITQAHCVVCQKLVAILYYSIPKEGEEFLCKTCEAEMHIRDEPRWIPVKASKTFEVAKTRDIYGDSAGTCALCAAPALTWEEGENEPWSPPAARWKLSVCAKHATHAWKNTDSALPQFVPFCAKCGCRPIALWMDYINCVSRSFGPFCTNCVPRSHVECGGCGKRLGYFVTKWGSFALATWCGQCYFRIRTRTMPHQFYTVCKPKNSKIK